ncbi:hypothetical protein RchiOBHm_Chr5g0042141 [Rosa chinensis]|uniref:Uncharacterized protein n=1 Tax=Rosa chinensis TaxID=74649 RepID=A0A2P6QD00_ROSCH|nr:hypothetical protein RchiOBHm_Chr5g0042141 [Rosa chinensis]
MFHGLLSPPAHPVWKCNGRIATTMTNKRKASNDNLMLQPPLKKLAHDGMVGALPMNTMQRDWHSESVGEVECAI